MIRKLRYLVVVGIVLIIIFLIRQARKHEHHIILNENIIKAETSKNEEILLLLREISTQKGGSKVLKGSVELGKGAETYKFINLNCLSLMVGEKILHDPKIESKIASLANFNIDTSKLPEIQIYWNLSGVDFVENLSFYELRLLITPDCSILSNEKNIKF